MIQYLFKREKKCTRLSNTENKFYYWKDRYKKTIQKDKSLVILLDFSLLLLCLINNYFSWEIVSWRHFWIKYLNVWIILRINNASLTLTYSTTYRTYLLFTFLNNIVHQQKLIFK